MTATLPAPVAQPATVTPAWLTSYVQSYSAGEAIGFVLHGDVEGLAFEGITNRGLLHETLRQRREVVASYSIARGITIHDEDEEVRVPAATGGTTMASRGAIARSIVAPPPGAQPTGALAAVSARVGTGGGTTADPFAQADSPLRALGLLTALLRSTRRVAVIIEHADMLVPVATMAGKGGLSGEDRRVLATLLDWARDEVISRNGNPIFLVARSLEELHADVRAADSGWRALHLRLPRVEERLAYLEWYLQTRRDDDRPILLADGLTPTELAQNTAGLSLRNIEDVLLVGAQRDGVARALVKEYKDHVISTQYSEVAEMVDPLPGGFADLGGMQPLKEWALADVIEPVRQGRTGDVPKGILLVGPPGTGKTYFVRALAREVGFNAVALNSSQILGGIVGESEGKLKRFFDFARSLAPTLVFLDELDQSDLSSRGNSSGNPVAKNLFSAMLQFMSDETLRGKVVMIFASNRPDLLDPAILRFGRMDAIVPVLLPDEEERKAIAQAQARGQRILLEDNARDVLAARTEGYSAADIGAVVRKARLIARRAGALELTTATAEQALAAIRPGTAQQAEWYTNLAIAACNDVDLLPERYRALLDDRSALQASIERSAGSAAPPREPSGTSRSRRDW